MATKSSKSAEPSERGEEAADSPVLDSMTAAVRKLVARGKEQGYVTYDDLNEALPPDEVNSEQIEDTMTQLSEMGINVVENEESEDAAGDDKSGTKDTAAEIFQHCRIQEIRTRSTQQLEQCVISFQVNMETIKDICRIY